MRAIRKNQLTALTPTLARLEAVLALPFHENSGDVALVQSHRELMRTGLQKVRAVPVLLYAAFDRGIRI